MKIFRHISLTAALMAVFTFAAAAQISLTSLDGSRVNLEAQSGKVVILAIGARWLPLSEKQADFSNLLAKKYAGKNVVVYFVATDSVNSKSKNFASNETLAKFVTDNGLRVPILRDPDGAATLKRYKLDQLPSFVILNKSGGQAGDALGGIDPKFDITIPISKRVDSLL